MYATSSSTSARGERLVVPRLGACCTRASAASCSVALGDGRFRPQRGRRSACAAASDVEVLSGLAAGERDRRLGHLPDRVGEPAARGAGAVVTRAASRRARARSRADRRLRARRGLTLLARRGRASLGRRSRCARTPLDAIPDLSDVQVIVFTEWPGQSPDLVEDQITYPISTRAALGAGRALRARPVVLRPLLRLRDLRGRHRSLLGAQPRARVPERRRRRACRRACRRCSGPTRPASAGSSSTRSSTAAAGSISRSCAASRTGSCATRSRACRASPRWRRSAASCASTRSRSIRTSCSRFGITLGDVIARGARVERGRRRQQPRARRARVRDPRARLRGRGSRICGACRSAPDAHGAPVRLEDVAEVRARPGHAARRRRARRRGRGGGRHRRDAQRRERARA